MYSSLFTSMQNQSGFSFYLMHILFDSEIIYSEFVKVPIGSPQDDLDLIANNVIDRLEGLDG